MLASCDALASVRRIYREANRREEKITEANCALLFFDGGRRELDEPMECAWLEMVQRWTPALWWCNRLIQSFFHSATDEFFEPIQQFSFCWFSFHPWLYTIFGARSFLCAHRRANGTKRRRKEELNVTIGKKSGREKFMEDAFNLERAEADGRSLGLIEWLWIKMESDWKCNWGVVQSSPIISHVWKNFCYSWNGKNVLRRSIAALIAASCTRLVFIMSAQEHSDGMRWSSCSSLLRTLQAFHEK